MFSSHNSPTASRVARAATASPERCDGVKPCDQVGHLVQARFRRRPRRDERRQPPVVGKAPHFDDMVEHSTGVVVERHDAQVHVGREAAIEHHLAFTLPAT